MAISSGGLVGGTKSEAPLLDKSQQPEVLDAGAIRDRIFKPIGREVVIDGCKFRIMPLSFGERMGFLKDATEANDAADGHVKQEYAVKMTMQILVQVVCDGDGNPIFGEGDAEKLWVTPLGGTMAALMKEAKAELEGGADEPSKESGETESSSSPA